MNTMTEIKILPVEPHHLKMAIIELSTGGHIPAIPLEEQKGYSPDELYQQWFDNEPHLPLNQRTELSEEFDDNWVRTFFNEKGEEIFQNKPISPFNPMYQIQKDKFLNAIAEIKTLVLIDEGFDITTYVKINDRYKVGTVLQTSTGSRIGDAFKIYEGLIQEAYRLCGYHGELTDEQYKDCEQMLEQVRIELNAGLASKFLN